jgi:hypothetical protein
MSEAAIAESQSVGFVSLENVPCLIDQHNCHRAIMELSTSFDKPNNAILIYMQ